MFPPEAIVGDIRLGLVAEVEHVALLLDPLLLLLPLLLSLGRVLLQPGKKRVVYSTRDSMQRRRRRRRRKRNMRARWRRKRERMGRREVLCPLIAARHNLFLSHHHHHYHS